MPENGSNEVAEMLFSYGQTLYGVAERISDETGATMDQAVQLAAGSLTMLMNTTLYQVYQALKEKA